MAHDASHFLLTPNEVAVPRTVDDVVALFTEAHTTDRPLTFRSGGTSFSGQAVSDALLVDTRRFFAGIEVLDDGARVRVGPGAILADVNAALRRHGRRLGPDPAGDTVCTIGGVIANNSSGVRCGTAQNTYATLESMVLVLPSGLRVDTSLLGADMELRLHEPDLVEGLTLLRHRILRNPTSIATIRHQFSMKNTMGYGLNAFLDYRRPIDLARALMIGSEGTLGFVAEATFKTVPLHEYGAAGLAIFRSLDDAAAAVPRLVEAGFDAIELMDATSLRIAAKLPEATPELRSLDVRNHAGLLLELQSATADKLAERIDATAETLAQLSLTHPVALVQNATARASLWRLRDGLYAAVAADRRPGTAALLEDIGVPVSELPATCEALSALLDKHDYDDAVIFGHARDGNLHFILNENFAEPHSKRRYQRFTRELVRLVLKAGGTLKAEHGTGRAMAPFVRDQYGDELYEIMREIKSLFDPHTICNPDVIITNDTRLHVRDLKAGSTDDAPEHDSPDDSLDDGETGTSSKRSATGRLARNLSRFTTSGSAALSSDALLRPIRAVARLGSRSAETTDESSPKPASRRIYPPKQRGPAPRVAFFRSCPAVGPAARGVFATFTELCRRAGIAVEVVESGDLRTVAPRQPKRGIREKLQAKLKLESPVIVVSDASSCLHSLETSSGSIDGHEVTDILEFTAHTLLPRLRVWRKFESIALPEPDPLLEMIARRISDDVVLENAAPQHEPTVYATAKGTCALGMPPANGRSRIHILELLDQATRAHT